MPTPLADTGCPKRSRTTRSGWKLLSKPAQQSVSDFREKVRLTLKRLHGSNARCLIKVLNPIIRGWANYYRGVVSSKLFHKLEADIFWKLRRWISKYPSHHILLLA